MADEDGSVRIRPMRPADVDAVAALEAATFSRPWSVETFRRLVGEATVLVRVADVVGTVAGYGVVMAVADQGEIANLAVAAQHRGRGLGGRLLDALLAAAAGAGVTRVYLEVRPSNTAARRLYAARGFTALGRRRDYYEAPREDALVLSADLTTTTNDGAGGTA